MHGLRQQLRERLDRLSREWLARGLPTREELLCTAAELEAWKAQNDVAGIWPYPPRLITATLDDGLGHGLELIERFARILGLSVSPMGLLREPAAIVARCQKETPDFLGLTVLQLDSDDDLAAVGRHLPPRTRLIAGGPAFRLDPDLAVLCNVSYVAENLAGFMDYILANNP